MQNTLYLSLWHLSGLLELQIKGLEDKMKQERETSKLQVSEVEKKLESLKQDLDVIKSALQEKNAECAALQRNLQELEELREMKQALVTYLDLYVLPFNFLDNFYLVIYFLAFSGLFSKNTFIDLSCHVVMIR